MSDPTSTSNPHHYYITTPIYYVNDKPHIGHCYTTLLADVVARFQRLARGEPVVPRLSGPQAPSRPVFFLTGTDENADKVVTSAAANGVTPQVWADRNAAEFRAAFAFMNCSFDDFLRTTESRHTDKVTGYIRRLLGTGDVYRGEYTGWYDPGQEEYVTETAAKENQYKSPISGKPLERRTEPCYFFRLSQYQDRLKQHIEAHPEFVLPDSRRSEVLGRLRLGLQDVPISRPVTDDPATQWGIRMPGDPANRIYVWIDALFNYLTAVDTQERRKLWPPAVQLIGKDILWFHAVIWPALLLALGEQLPRTVFGHGWWISEGQKMSKSLGNFIDLAKLRAYAGRYSLDALRWYLVTQGPMSGADSDFSHAKFVEVYNSDLANGIGNSTSRVANMIAKYFGGAVPAPEGTPTIASVSSVDWPAIARNAVAAAAACAARFDLNGMLRQGTELVRQVDGYINVTEPFRLAKRLEAEQGLRTDLAVILYNCAEALRIATLLLSPAMPEKMAELWGRWGCASAVGVPLAELANFGSPHGLRAGAGLTVGNPLFMRADPAEAAPTV